jgi:hypothetical protein
MHRPNGSTVAVYYVHADYLGTARKVTRPSDNGLMWRWGPNTFGSIPANSNPARVGTLTYNLGFPGQYYLPELSFYPNYFRDYDPQTERYVEGVVEQWSRSPAYSESDNKPWVLPIT